MKAILLNAGAKAVMVHTNRDNVRFEAMSFKTSMRFITPPWSYRQEGDKLVLKNGSTLEVFVDAKDVGFSYT